MTTVVRTIIDPQPPQLDPAGSTLAVDQKELTNAANLNSLWNSTPLQAAIWGLVGAVGSQFSLVFLSFIVWAVAVIEFSKRAFFAKMPALRLASVLVFAIAIGFGLRFVWRVTPRSQAPPSIDQQSDQILEEFARKFPWLAKQPNERQAQPSLPNPAQPQPQSVPAPRSGQVEIYFGDPSPARGTEVTFRSDSEKQALFAAGAQGGKFNSRLFSVRRGVQDQDITIFVRNVSAIPITNASVTISSDKRITAVSPGYRFGKNSDLVYDIRDLRPYRDAGEELAIVVKLRTNSTAFDPTPLLVTVDGLGMSKPHSEITETAFVELPI